MEAVDVDEGLQPPAFVTPLKPLHAADGEEVVFHCCVIGNPHPQISWYHNEKCIDNNEEFVINYNPESGDCDLVIVEVFPEDHGWFKCIASNPVGEAVSSAELTVSSFVTTSEAETSELSELEIQVGPPRQPPPTPAEEATVQLTRDALSDSVKELLEKTSQEMISEVTEMEESQTTREDTTSTAAKQETKPQHTYVPVQKVVKTSEESVEETEIMEEKVEKKKETFQLKPRIREVHVTEESTTTEYQSEESHTSSEETKVVTEVVRDKRQPTYILLIKDTPQDTKGTQTDMTGDIEPVVHTVVETEYSKVVTEKEEDHFPRETVSPRVMELREPEQSPSEDETMVAIPREKVLLPPVEQTTESPIADISAGEVVVPVDIKPTEEHRATPEQPMVIALGEEADIVSEEPIVVTEIPQAEKDHTQQVIEHMEAMEQPEEETLPVHVDTQVTPDVIETITVSDITIQPEQIPEGITQESPTDQAMVDQPQTQTSEITLDVKSDRPQLMPGEIQIHLGPGDESPVVVTESRPSVSGVGISVPQTGIEDTGTATLESQTQEMEVSSLTEVKPGEYNI